METWIDQYSDVVNLGDEIYALIQERNRLLSRGGDVVNFNTKIFRQISHFDTQVQILNGDLEMANINQQELQRRMILVQQLQDKGSQLLSLAKQDTNLNVGISNNIYNNNNNSSSNKRGRNWGGPKEDEDTIGLSNNQILDLEEEKIKEQDKRLDHLQNAIGNIKGYAGDINDEIDEHLVLLDDLEVNVEKADYKINKQTHKVESLQQKAATGGLWCCVFILLILIIVLVLIPS
eukprot:TRINITY_DN1820_c0_g2_i1.p1 TRINITY_DN1820_c0_g2~~TRINITY_DN1820_c0_g2_i1.p1  ORF type:complete len:234 (-),score=39.90 TRINITY_DN1820_c0_g2_i1:102-803(-)